MKVTYTFANGENTIIEVDEKWGEVLVEFDRQEHNNNQTETRRHTSLDAMDYEGEFFAANDSYFETMFDDPDDIDRLQEALKVLLPSQKALLKALYVDGLTQEEYAKKMGVHRTAINKQHIRILKKLKKFYE